MVILNQVNTYKLLQVTKQFLQQFKDHENDTFCINQIKFYSSFSFAIYMRIYTIGTSKITKYK